jgi:hypothetical protein
MEQPTLLLVIYVLKDPIWLKELVLAKMEPMYLLSALLVKQDKLTTVVVNVKILVLLQTYVGKQ